MKTLFFFLGILLFQMASPLKAGEIDKYEVGVESKKKALVIDPKLRALDYQQVFETLRKEKPSNKVCIKLLDGAILSNIIEMQRMTNNTLFLVRYNTPQGIKLQAIELELIQGIGYLD